MESSNGLPTPAKRPRSRWLKRRLPGGHRWLRTYRAGPAAQGRGIGGGVLAVLAVLAVLVIVAVSHLGLLVVGR